jgi:hypothetical protein
MCHCWSKRDSIVEKRAKFKRGRQEHGKKSKKKKTKNSNGPGPKRFAGTGPTEPKATTSTPYL